MPPSVFLTGFDLFFGKGSSKSAEHRTYFSIFVCFWVLVFFGLLVAGRGTGSDTTQVAQKQGRRRGIDLFYIVLFGPGLLVFVFGFGFCFCSLI
jgi:hypothetical protein